MRKIGDGEMSDSHKVETMEAPQIADVLRATSDALDWYAKVGPAEALSWVLIARAAFFRAHSPADDSGWLDIGAATKH
jgi:hypothetical protein